MWRPIWKGVSPLEESYPVPNNWGLFLHMLKMGLLGSVANNVIPWTNIYRAPNFRSLENSLLIRVSRPRTRISPLLLIKAVMYKSQMHLLTEPGTLTHPLAGSSVLMLGSTPGHQSTLLILRDSQGLEISILKAPLSEPARGRKIHT